MTQIFDLTGTDLVERFLRYVRIDTRADESCSTAPSSPGQLELGRLLVDELTALGLTDARQDEHGLVTATLPGNLPPGQAAGVPVVAFIAHLDTYHEVSGRNVQPILHRDYDGGDLILPGAPERPLRAADNPALADCRGDTVITSDGTTLLGADDKAGIAEIMAALHYLVHHPEFPRGTLKVAFTPDEEIGKGTAHFDVAAFGADVAYTVDGSAPGEVENETFCADTAIVRLRGRDVHPGYAKGRMVNAVRAAADLIGRFRPDALPETTTDRDGYLHPIQIDGNVSETRLTILLRDFEVEGLRQKRAWLEEWAGQTRRVFPGLEIDVTIQESYRNMVYPLRDHPEVVEHALEAVRRAGLTPRLTAIRGGTDGARLTYMGLPTPNLFAGGINFHSTHEWVAAGTMERAVQTLLHLVAVWRDARRA